MLDGLLVMLMPCAPISQSDSLSLSLKAELLSFLSGDQRLLEKLVQFLETEGYSAAPLGLLHADLLCL